MGSCGCGDYGPGLRLPGPLGITYTLSFYTGCAHCSCPPALIITRHDRESAGSWGDHNIPEPTWQPFSREASVNAETFLPVVDLGALKAAIAAGIKAEDEGDEDDRHIPDDEGRAWLVDLMLEEARVAESHALWWPTPSVTETPAARAAQSPERGEE